MVQPQSALDKRLELQTLLESLLPDGHKAHFQPPEGTKLEYPCITYERDSAETTFADNLPWSHEFRYRVTVIDRDPDSDIPEKVKQLPKSRFSRHFTTAGLNHDIYNLYY